MTKLRPAVPDVGNDVHDRAAIGLHPAGVYFAHADKAAGQIVEHDSLESLGGDRSQRRTKLSPGIVDEAIDAPISREHRIDRGPHHGFIADVASLAHRLPAIRLDLALHF